MQDYREVSRLSIESSLETLRSKGAKVQASLENLIRIWTSDGDFGRFGERGDWKYGYEKAGKILPKEDELAVLKEFYSTHDEKADQLVAVIFRDCVDKDELANHRHFVELIQASSSIEVSCIGEELMRKIGEI